LKEDKAMNRNILKFAALVVVTVCIVVALTSIAICKSDRMKKDELYQNIDLFSDGYTIIQSGYIEEVDSKDLVYGALKGMLSSLDPHSQFMDPDTYNELKADTSGKFGGLGIEITIKDGLLTVITPLEDTPAWKVGIKAGDYIVKINGELTRDITLMDAVKKLRGKPNTEVNLTVYREGEDKFLDFNIIRQIIKIEDIKDARILEDGIGYVRLIEFRENTPKDLRAAIDKLKKQGMNALILDLRNNPGGLLEVAIEVTENFIERGKLIVSTRGRDEEQNMEFHSSNKKADLSSPLVILVNAGSASGSEIVAAALKDYRRAIIVGTNTFGKGSVQTVIPLGDGSAIRLTTSKYFSPNGDIIHGKGVKPDIEVEEARIKLVKEEGLAEGIFDVLEGEAQKESISQIPEEYRDDNQLMRAVDVLKAVKIYRYSF
jgi:carboxyl-terminal processing protease